MGPATAWCLSESVGQPGAPLPLSGLGTLPSLQQLAKTQPVTHLTLNALAALASSWGYACLPVWVWLEVQLPSEWGVGLCPSSTRVMGLGCLLAGPLFGGFPPSADQRWAPLTSLSGLHSATVCPGEALLGIPRRKEA